MLDKIRENKLFVGISLVIILFIVIISFWSVKNYKTLISNKLDIMNSAYIIPGVPYYGVHNHFAGYLEGNTNSVFSVIEYWNPGLIESLKAKKNNLYVGNLSEVSTIFGKENFTAQTIKLSLSDLKKYINPEIKTPLLLSLPISVDQPITVKYYPLTLLIGINEKEQKLIFHNYWLGNNYEISYNEFNQLENSLPISQRNLYVVIQPTNLNEKLKEISQRKIEAYPARTSIMQNGEQMLKYYAIGSGAYGLKMNNIAREYLLKSENDTNFDEYLPPFFKTWMDNAIGQIYYDENDLDNALLYAQKAVAENHDLNQPFKDWLGIELDWRSGDETRFSSSYNLLGDLYRAKKDFQKAKDSYTEALRITPDSLRAKHGMEIITALGE